MEEPLLNTVSLVSMGATALMLVVSAVGSSIIYKRWQTTVVDRWVICWFIWDALIHFLVVSGDTGAIIPVMTINPSGKQLLLITSSLNKNDVEMSF